MSVRSSVGLIAILFTALAITPSFAQGSLVQTERAIRGIPCGINCSHHHYAHWRHYRYWHHRYWHRHYPYALR